MGGHKIFGHDFRDWTLARYVVSCVIAWWSEVWPGFWAVMYFRTLTCFPCCSLFFQLFTCCTVMTVPGLACYTAVICCRSKVPITWYCYMALDCEDAKHV